MPANRPTPTVPLAQLRPGDRGTMCAADLGSGECELLRAMGLGERCEFRVCRSGQTCILEVNATRLGLCSRMTRRIHVSPSVAGV